MYKLKYSYIVLELCQENYHCHLYDFFWNRIQKCVVKLNGVPVHNINPIVKYAYDFYPKVKKLECNPPSNFVEICRCLMEDGMLEVFSDQKD